MFVRRLANAALRPGKPFASTVRLLTTVAQAQPTARQEAALSNYQRDYKRSLEQSDAFWEEQALEFVTWQKKFDLVQHHDLERGLITWFTGGTLNVADNCIDRHLFTRGEQAALIWEADEPGTGRKVSYNELHAEVCRLANALLRYGVKKGDRVCLYMPMTPYAVYAMLACARIGAVHNVVFAGFGPDALAARIRDANCQVVITADEGVRGGKRIPLRSVVESALRQIPGQVEHVFVQRRTGSDEHMKPTDIILEEAMLRERPYCPSVPMASEDPLFLLYTSGSTGTPKGLVHSTGGYLTYAACTHKKVFDYRDGDIYACVADIGWITGHSYVVYGPLANGATTLLFESIPVYPDPGRYWQMVQEHKINQFYTAPTAVRLLMKAGTEYPAKYDLSSLRTLGSVGEPINPEAWKWFHTHAGRSQCGIVDTWWQTETGGIMIAPLPKDPAPKPGAAMRPFYGVEPVLLNDKGEELTDNGVEGMLALKRPTPGMARSVFGNHQRFLDTYFTTFRGYYFTGDGARRDEDGHIWITGRVDDVLNISGHRLGTAEVESALLEHHGVAESAVVGFPHDVKGQGIYAYVIVKKDYKPHDKTIEELRRTVGETIGKLATPDMIQLVPDLPKTRSGKIMRRILRKIASNEEDSLGDTSTLADPSIVDIIVKQHRDLLEAGQAPKA